MAEPSELDIGHVENETIYIPKKTDHDPADQALMRMGNLHEGDVNNLRDPWFDTDKGRAWLAEKGEV